MQFRIAAFIIFRQPYSVFVVPGKILARRFRAITVFIAQKFRKLNDFRGLAVLAQNMLFSGRVRILYDAIDKFIFFLLLRLTQSLLFRLFRFIPLFVVLLFLCSEVFILIDKVGDTHGNLIPF